MALPGGQVALPERAKGLEVVVPPTASWPPHTVLTTASALAVRPMRCSAFTMVTGQEATRRALGGVPQGVAGNPAEGGLVEAFREDGFGERVDACLIDPVRAGDGRGESGDLDGEFVAHLVNPRRWLPGSALPSP